MNEKRIQRTLIRAKFNHAKLLLTNYTPVAWFECDLFEVTKAGYMREYEIKTSRSDFFADAKKGKSGGTKTKHDELLLGNQYGPNQFWFVTPKGLLEHREVPPFAGLIEIDIKGRSTYFAKQPINAPRLHRSRFDMPRQYKALKTAYYRYNNLLDGKAI